MGYLGRRIGLSQDKGNSTPGGADGAVGGGILDLVAQGYFNREGSIYNAPGVVLSGLTATGGVISDYTSGTDIYRAHIFTSSGEFDVTQLGDFGDTVEYLVVAGGGAGGGTSSSGGGRGGGGAGGLRTNLTGHPLAGSAFPAPVATYTVTVGGGGGTQSQADGVVGSPSYFGPPSTPNGITATGGGAGGYQPTNNDGGSGGGTYSAGTPYVGLGNTPPTSPPQGNNSGQGGDQCASGGGGAGAVGTDGTGTAGGAGGAGVQVLIAGPPTSTGVGALNPGPGEYQWFAGGGGGAGSWAATPGVGADGGVGGGGAGNGKPTYGNAGKGEFSTGGGGGGATGDPGSGGYNGGSGGSGIVVVRYQVGSIAGSAKATGGAISFYGGKTIHTFTGSGTFATAPNWSSATVEYVVVGGGGGGGVNPFGGGGGAGAYRTGTTPIGAHPVSTTIQVGGGGIQNPNVQNPLPAEYQGTSSYFGTPITSPGGGGGGVDDGASPFPSSSPGEQGMPGGSGGGNALDTSGLPSGGTGTGDPFPGTIGATPSNGWGHDGGKGNRSPIGGGGGGGASAAGATPAPRLGGDGIQLPATFRDPASTVGAPGPTSTPAPNGFDDSGKYWVAGGGAGGGPAPSYTPTDGIGSAGGGGYWSTPTSPTRPNEMIGAVQNTGSGGGAGGPVGDPQAGGSGIVIIAYPT